MNQVPSLPADRSQSAEVKSERAAERARLQILYSHANTLEGHPAFRVYNAFVEQKVTELRAVALDPQKTSDERDFAVRALAIVDEIFQWVPETKRRTREVLQEQG